MGGGQSNDNNTNNIIGIASFEELEVVKGGDGFEMSVDLFNFGIPSWWSVDFIVDFIGEVLFMQLSGGSGGSVDILAKVESVTYSKGGLEVKCSSEDVKVKGKSAKKCRENGKKIKEGKYSSVAMMRVPSEEASKKGKESLCLIKAGNLKKTKDDGTYKVDNKCTQLVLKDGIIESSSVAYTELVSNNEVAALLVNGKTYDCKVSEGLLSEDSYECTNAINDAEKDEVVVLGVSEMNFPNRPGSPADRCASLNNRIRLWESMAAADPDARRRVLTSLYRQRAETNC